MKNQVEMLRVVAHLNAAISNARLYAAGHPQVVRYLERAHGELTHVLAHQPELTFIIVDDDVVVDNQPLTSKTPHLSQFVQLLRHCAIERITFTAAVSSAELTQLVGDLSSTHRCVVRSTPGIRLGKVQVRLDSESSTPDEMFTPETRQKMEALGQLRDHALDDLKDIYQQIKVSKQIATGGISQIVQGFVQGMLRNVNPLHMLSSLKASDEYTFTHAINVCILTMAQAEALGIGGAKLYDIGIAASLHDAGKMFVPDEILNKPEKLSSQEWEHMRNHSLHGAQYLLRLEGLTKLAFIAALEHHIRYDGTGYPELGRRWRPNLVSQMIAVADLFDAMRSRRPYKEPKPDDFIIKMIKKERGTGFNPLLVDNFLGLISA